MPLVRAREDIGRFGRVSYYQMNRSDMKVVGREGMVRRREQSAGKGGDLYTLAL